MIENKSTKIFINTKEVKQSEVNKHLFSFPFLIVLLYNESCTQIILSMFSEQYYIFFLNVFEGLHGGNNLIK